MRQRIITAVVGLPILFLVLFFYNTWVLALACGLMSAFMVYEILHNTGILQHNKLLIPSMLMALLMPFCQMPWLAPWFSLIVYLFAIVLLVFFFRYYHTLKFEELAAAFFVPTIYGFALSSIVYLRDLEPKLGLYYILMVFACAWLSDTGGYFFGRAFGKHKLAPEISPKKTVEGLIGGLFSSLVLNTALTYGYVFAVSKFGIQITVNLPQLLVMLLIATLIGVAGDLSASIIKRQRGIKDFGNLFPGHGGVMDRFDSIILIAPFLYFVTPYLPMVSLV